MNRYFCSALGAVLCFCSLHLTSSPASADEVCRPCPFDCEGIGAGRKDCKNLSAYRGQCCVDLDDRGKDQLEDRDRENTYGRHPRYDREDRYGRSRYNDPGAYDDKNGFQPGDCPVGYHVNDRPCTNDERQRGCSDLRSRSGQTCVGWNQRR